jgi:sensor histidine kinase YesM
MQIDSFGKIKSISNQFQIKDELIRNMEVVNEQLFFYSYKKLYRLQNQKLESISIYPNEISDIKLWNDKLILTTNNGLIINSIHGFFNQPRNNSFVINQLKVSGEEYNYQKNHEFEHFQNTIEINYSLLSFSETLPLYYRINGCKWESTSEKSRVLKLVSLAPDDYIIDFKIGNTKKSIIVTSIHFSIQTPWYLRTWVLIVWIGLLITFLYSYLNWQIQILKKRNKLLSEKIELEESLTKSILTSIKSQMNPHFFYNALNTIQSFIFSDDKKNATSYLSKFSKLTRMILEMSEQDRIPLKDEIKALTLYLDIEKVRFNNDFEFTIDIEEELDIEFIKIPSMIIQPYVENAIKHGLLHLKEHKKLDIQFRKQQNKLIVEIDDNGIGRKRSEELNKIKHEKHESFSTKANQKRLELLNKDKDEQMAVQFIDKMNETDMAIGTTVIISIPI